MHVVQPPGGLKLALTAATREDRRLRFAHVSLSEVNSRDGVLLVTDSRGRLRYRLSEGEYRLQVAGGPEVRFAVRDDRWTMVHLRLI